MEAIARLRNYPTSPMKMRLLADLIRGMSVQSALTELSFNPKHPSTPLRKLLLSAISNWKQKNNIQETEGLYIKTIYVDGARSLKRMLPAPQGRAYRIKKRSNHVTIIVDKRMEREISPIPPKEAEKKVDKKTPRTKKPLNMEVKEGSAIKENPTPSPAEK